eukprot:jgi/Chlat1/3915/Chrsp26S04185
MASAVCSTSGLGSAASSFSGESLRPQASSHRRSQATGIHGAGPVCMANPHEGKGVFAPVVVVARNVITEFCKSIGADSKQRQGLIRLAKKNGEKLGFLA